MDIRIESYKNLSSIPEHKYRLFLRLVEESFPNVFEDKDEIYLNFKDNHLDLAFLDERVVGFVSYNEDGKDIVNIDYLGVIQDDKYLNRGIATELINRIIDKYDDKDILLNCRASNDRARYLYHKLGFELYEEGNSNFYGKMYRFALNTNKKYNRIASVLYEAYKENKRRDNESIEETLMDMYENKLYDNIYQYDIEQEEIDKVIGKSKLFIKCVAVLKEAMNEDVKEDDLFANIESNIGLSLYSNVYLYESMFDLSKQDKRDLYKIFGLIRIKKIDDTLTKSIKR